MNNIKIVFAMIWLFIFNSVSASVKEDSIEIEAFSKRYFPDSSRDMKDMYLNGASIGYFLTDDVRFGFSYGVYNDGESTNETGKKSIHGHLASIDATYQFKLDQNNNLKPYISAGFGHQNITNMNSSNYRRQTLKMMMVGTGLKYYFLDSYFLKIGADAQYGLENRSNSHQLEWMGNLAIGMNFGD